MIYVEFTLAPQKHFFLRCQRKFNVNHDFNEFNLPGAKPLKNHENEQNTIELWSPSLGPMASRQR